MGAFSPVLYTGQDVTLSSEKACSDFSACFEAPSQQLFAARPMQLSVMKAWSGLGLLMGASFQFLYSARCGDLSLTCLCQIHARIFCPRCSVDEGILGLFGPRWSSDKSTLWPSAHVGTRASAPSAARAFPLAEEPSSFLYITACMDPSFI